MYNDRCSNNYSPMVGIVLTDSPSFSRYNIEVLPALSNPTINSRISFCSKKLLNQPDKVLPICCLMYDEISCKAWQAWVTYNCSPRDFRLFTYFFSMKLCELKEGNTYLLLEEQLLTGFNYKINCFRWNVYFGGDLKLFEITCIL